MQLCLKIYAMLQKSFTFLVYQRLSIGAKIIWSLFKIDLFFFLSKTEMKRIWIELLKRYRRDGGYWRVMGRLFCGYHSTCGWHVSDSDAVWFVSAQCSGDNPLICSSLNSPRFLTFIFLYLGQVGSRRLRQPSPEIEGIYLWKGANAFPQMSPPT